MTVYGVKDLKGQLHDLLFIERISVCTFRKLYLYYPVNSGCPVTASGLPGHRSRLRTECHILDSVLVYYHITKTLGLKVKLFTELKKTFPEVFKVIIKCLRSIRLGSIG
jgi:hypothetical protein